MNFKKVQGGWMFDDGIFVKYEDYLEIRRLTDKADTTNGQSHVWEGELIRESIQALHDYHADLQMEHQMLKAQAARLKSRLTYIKTKYPGKTEADAYKSHVLHPVRIALAKYKLKHADK